MSIKHPFFGQQHHGRNAAHGEDSGGESASGPEERRSDDPDAAAQDPLRQNKSAKEQARARDAYAARQGGHGTGGGDGLPPFTPGGAGPVGGLFVDDPAGPSGHGLKNRAEGEPLGDEEIALLCAERFCSTCQVKKEADDARLRAMADLDNAKKRLDREREEQVRFAAEGVLSDIVPALDNLDLALLHANKTDACKNFIVGVEMTRKLLLESLQKHGLARIGAVGEEFDPARHEAVGMQNAPEVPEGYVCGLLACGYTLKDRLLRPARVMVCKKS